MRLRDHIPDADRYLAHDCYCPGEVYDLTGFFYEVYSGDDWFTPLVRTGAFFDDGSETWVGICRGEFLIVMMDADGTRVENMQRVPIGPNNWRFFAEVVRNGEVVEGLHLDPGEDTMRSLRRLMSMSSGVVISD